MNKSLILLISCIGWASCQQTSNKTLEACPVVAQTQEMNGHPLTVCSQSALSDTLQIPLSLLAEELEIIRFDNREEALMGEQQVVVSEHYLAVWNVWNQNFPVRLFDRKGNFLCNIGAVGQGPGEYQAIYDICIDEAAGRIYLLPWTRSELLVYDLEGNVQPSVPLCLRVNKGKLRFRTDSLLTVFCLPFPDTPAVLWTQDLTGRRTSYIESGPLTAYDYNSEVYSCGNLPGVFDCMIRYSLPSRKDTLYHYDMEGNRLLPHFTMAFTTDDPVPEHDYFELPHHFIGRTAETIWLSPNIASWGNVKNFIVDKRTGKGAYMHLVNDFLGNEEIPITNYDRNFPPYPNFRDGYYILNQDPGNLRERLENSLRKGLVAPEKEAQVNELLHSIGEDDNNILFLARLKQ